jgi:hypothetical protein
MGDGVWFHLAESVFRIVSFLGYPWQVPSIAPSLTANPDLAAGIASGDRGADDPASPGAPRLLRRPGSPGRRRGELLDSLLTTASTMGTTPDARWPGRLYEHGRRADRDENAIAPALFDVSGFGSSTQDPRSSGTPEGGAPRGRRAVRVYSPSSAETHCKGLHRPHDRSARNHICATAGDDQAAAALRLGAAQRLPRGRSKRCRKGHGRLSGDAIQSSDPHETNGRIRQLLTPAEYGTCGEVRGQQRRTRSLKRSYTG